MKDLYSDFNWRQTDVFGLSYGSNSMKPAVQMIVKEFEIIESNEIRWVNLWKSERIQKYRMSQWIFWYDGIDWSSVLPDKESDVVSVQQNTGFGLVIEVRAEVDSTNHVPATFELLFEAFLYVLCRIFQVRNLASHHLHVNVFSNEHGIFFILQFHVTELDFRGDGDVGGSPVFRDAGAGHLFLFLFLVRLLVLLLLRQCRHSYLNIIKFKPCLALYLSTHDK